jgi:peptidoglycan/LPS O-acetylase OafA/YrhL
MTAFLKWFQATDRFLVLRGAAALAVIAYHTQDSYRTIFKPLHILGHDISWLFLADGGMAVRVFFTLSGFLMFKAFYTHRYALDRTGITKFFRARISRIAPLYFFFVLVFVALLFPGILSLHNLPTLVSLLTFTYSGAQPPAFANAFWALSTEVEFYVLVPVLVLLTLKLISKRGQTWLAAVAVLAFGISMRWLFRHGPVTAYGNLLTNLDTFLLGGLVCIWLYGFETNKPSNLSPAVCLTFGLILFPVLSALQFKYTFGFAVIGPTIATAITAAYIWASEKIEQGEYDKTTYRLGEIIKKPTMWPAYLGVLSYGIYLWHQPIAGAVQYSGIVAKTGWKAWTFEFAIIVILAILCAAVTNRYIEQAKTYRN